MSNHFNRSFAALAFTIIACGAHEQSATPVRIAATTADAIVSPVPETRGTSGTVRSTTVSPLSAKVMGNVTRVFVSEGDRVHRGQPLVEIDAHEIQAKVAQAQAGSHGVEAAIASADAAVTAATANADLASATLRRYTALRERGSASAQEFEEVSAKAAAASADLERAKKTRDQLMAQRDQSRAGIDEAEAFLGYATVRSPIDGIVTARMVDPGAQAAPGMPLVTVEDPSSRRIETFVDETLAAKLRVGDEVMIDGLKPVTTSRIANIATVDPSSRSALVKIALPHDSPLASGSFVHVRFTTGARNALTIPSAAVSTRGQLTMVYVVDAAHIVRMRLITPGDSFDGRTEVLSGLDAGERVVTSANAREGAAL